MIALDLLMLIIEWVAVIAAVVFLVFLFLLILIAFATAYYEYLDQKKCS